MIIYVVSAAGDVQKVGVTCDLERRQRELANQSGRELVGAFYGETPFARKVEQEIHATLGAHRLKGEWFAVSAEIAEAAFDAAWKRVHGFPVDPYVWIDPWKAP